MMLLCQPFLPPAQQLSVPGFLIGLGIVVCVIGLAGYGVARLVRRRRLASRLHLFGELCRVHGLETTDIGLLRRIAAKHDLAQPGALFVDPRFLDQLIELPDGDFQHENLIRLRERLFHRKDVQLSER